MFAPVAQALTRPLSAEHVLGWAGDRPVTWGEIRARAFGVSRALAEQRARGAVLACSSPINFFAALLGTWLQRGEALVPQSLQPESVSGLARSQVPVLADEDVLPLHSAHAEATLPPPEECRLALHTSGSTGAAKRVDKTLEQFDREIENLQAVWGHALDGASVLATVPHYHIYGLLFRVLWPFAAARPADGASCADPVELRTLAAKRGRYVLVSTPAHLARFPDLMPLAEWVRPAGIFSSGGPLDAASAARYRQGFGGAPFEVFGSTETGGVAWRQRDGSALEDAWTPFPGIRVAVGREGALVIDSPYLPQRDWQMDDGAEMLSDDRFMLRGRLDRIVKVAGKRLSLPELEQLLARHEWVAAAGALRLPGQERVAVVVAPSAAGAAAMQEKGARAVREELRRHLGRTLDPSLLPRWFRFVDKLPFDERGKLPVAQLERLFETPADDA